MFGARLGVLSFGLELDLAKSWDLAKPHRYFGVNPGKKGIYFVGRSS